MVWLVQYEANFLSLCPYHVSLSRCTSKMRMSQNYLQVPSFWNLPPENQWHIGPVGSSFPCSFPCWNTRCILPISTQVSFLMIWIVDAYYSVSGFLFPVLMAFCFSVLFCFCLEGWVGGGELRTVCVAALGRTCYFGRRTHTWRQ